MTLAAIFAGDLFRMYSKFAEKRGWKVNIVDLNEGTAGGFKEIIIEINGENVYGTLKFESTYTFPTVVMCQSREEGWLIT